MRVNEVLKTLTLDDLNQRYRKTYIRYNNDVVMCNGFSSSRMGGVGTVIGIQKSDGLYLDPFDYTKLDVRRPEPRWVVAGDEKYPLSPMYLSYRMARQWQRGFSEATCIVTSPLRRVYSITDVELKAWFDAPKVTGLTPIADVFDKLETVGYMVLSPTICVVKRAIERVTTKEIYFRTTQIGSINGAKITFKLPDFEPEFNDCVIR